MQRVLTHIGLVLVLVLGFVGGELARDIVAAHEAEASSVSGGAAQCQTGSGSLVCGTSPTLVTPNIGAASGTNLTLTQGISAVTGAFSGTLTAVGLSSTITGSTAAATLNNAGSTTGFALRITGDTTSPAVAPLALDALDANPTASGLIGAVFVFTGGYLRVQTGFSPTVWNDVGGFFSVTTGVTAHAGGGQASATLVCASANHTTVATVGSANDSIVLPATPVVGQECPIKNKGANTLALFPGSGDVLCVSGGACGAADASTTIAANAELRCWAESASTWNCK